MTQSEPSAYQSSDGRKPWENAELLKELYRTQQMTAKEVGEELGCSRTTICRKLRKYDIEIRGGPGFYRGYQYVPLGYKGGGYPAWRHSYDGELRSVPVHQLLAIAEGANPHELFGDRELVVHHRNGVKWDNRPDNLEVFSASEHGNVHERATDAPWQDGEVLERLYVTQGKSIKDVAEELGCSSPTVQKWMERHGIEARPPGKRSPRNG